MKKLDLVKIRKETNRLGRESGELAVKIFHNSITSQVAEVLQRRRCSKMVGKYGLQFAREVYKNVYAVITSINIERQKIDMSPANFFTDGMDSYFKRLGINPYDDSGKIIVQTKKQLHKPIENNIPTPTIEKEVNEAKEANKISQSK